MSHIEDDPGGAREHLRLVLSREYWRCAGHAENARREAIAAGEVEATFMAECEKWQARLRMLKEALGGEVPENLTPDEYRRRIELEPVTEGG